MTQVQNQFADQTTGRWTLVIILALFVGWPVLHFATKPKPTAQQECVSTLAEVGVVQDARSLQRVCAQ